MSVEELEKSNELNLATKGIQVFDREEFKKYEGYQQRVCDRYINFVYAKKLQEKYLKEKEKGSDNKKKTLTVLTKMREVHFKSIAKKHLLVMAK